MQNNETAANHDQILTISEALGGVVDGVFLCGECCCCDERCVCGEAGTYVYYVVVCGSGSSSGSCRSGGEKSCGKILFV